MGNELKDIANKLCPYDTLMEGWAIISALKRPDGTWSLVVKPIKTEESDGSL